MPDIPVAVEAAAEVTVVIVPVDEAVVLALEDPDVEPEVAVDAPEDELLDVTVGHVKLNSGVVPKVVPSTPNCGWEDVSVFWSTSVYCGRRSARGILQER